MSVLRLFSRTFPGPWQLALCVGVLALAACVVGALVGELSAVTLLIPGVFFGIAWVKRAMPGGMA
jgi:hypothetical protein